MPLAFAAAASLRVASVPVLRRVVTAQVEPVQVEPAQVAVSLPAREPGLALRFPLPALPVAWALARAVLVSPHRPPLIELRVPARASLRAAVATQHAGSVFPRVLWLAAAVVAVPVLLARWQQVVPARAQRVLRPALASSLREQLAAA